MKAPNVQVKSVKFHEGHEGQGVNADVFINGVKVYHVLDDGNGGCLDIYMLSFDAKTKALAKELNDFVDSIPEKPLDFGKGPIKDKDGNVRMSKTTLEDYINELLYAYERKKDEMKKERLMVDGILIGRPDGDSYVRLKFNKPLSEILTLQLQVKVNEIKKRQCVNGVQILNTNLQSLGINF